MRLSHRPALLLPLFLMALVGCGVNTPPPSTLDVAGNWQIQTLPPASGSPTPGLLLLGALQGSGSNVTGTFSFADLAQGSACFLVNQIVSFTGTVDSGSNLTLSSAPFQGGSVITVKLPLATTLFSFTTGTIAITGGTCASSSSPAIAASFASLTGSYSGTLNLLSSTGQPSSTNAAATLTLDQSPTPNPQGQFPVTGSLNLNAGTCTGLFALTGKASGAALTLTSADPLAPAVPILNAAENPTGTPLTVTVDFVSSVCSKTSPAIYTGSLTHQ